MLDSVLARGLGLASALAVALFLSGLGVAPARAAEPAAATAVPQTVTLSASQGRQLQLKVWPAAAERAVIVFSAGGGGNPAAYDRMLSAWAKAGFTVIAPLHDDPLAKGDVSGSNGQISFAARIEDLAIARGYTKATRPGRPLVVAGHSFGSLMSLISVGAVTPAGPQADPDIRGVIVFSSPGKIPGLLTRDAYAPIAVPMLMITGDHDQVPGFVTDWRDHRMAFDTSEPGDKTLLVFTGAGHGLIVDADAADFAVLVAATTAFVEANALGEAAAKTRLAAQQPGGGLMIERR